MIDKPTLFTNLTGLSLAIHSCNSNSSRNVKLLRDFLSIEVGLFSATRLPLGSFKSAQGILLPLKPATSIKEIKLVDVKPIK